MTERFSNPACVIVQVRKQIAARPGSRKEQLLLINVQPSRHESDLVRRHHRVEPSLRKPVWSFLPIISGDLKERVEYPVITQRLLDARKMNIQLLAGNP